MVVTGNLRTPLQPTDYRQKELPSPTHCTGERETERVRQKKIKKRKKSERQRENQYIALVFVFSAKEILSRKFINSNK